MKKTITILFTTLAALCLAPCLPAQVVNFAPPAGIKKFSFYPQGGNFFGDLYPTNFVDLDTSSGILAYNGSDYTYDMHNGCDTDINGFTAQAIGVPVFAVLDGTVTQAHDGEFDMNTMFNTLPSNHVVIDHGDGQTTTYEHLRKGSVAVVVGQQVVAGEQIGLTASSGNSTQPHLHFQCDLNDQLYEPFSGSARPGVSGWVSQPPFRTDAYLRQFIITDQDLTSFAGPPYDTTRKGTFFTGLQPINTWFQFGNGEGITSLTLSYLRPDGSVLYTTTAPLSGFARNGFVVFNFNLNMDAVGAWKIELKVNGKFLANAPFTVLAPGSAIANHAPGAVTAVLDPVTPNFASATFCRITSPTVFLDPDYDFVRYHYVWKVNGKVVRDTISAGLADAIPRDAGKAGDKVTCTVTPSDGIANGPSTLVPTPTAGGLPLLNISTRLNVGTGDNVLIGGFIIDGTEAKEVIIRASGPSLSEQGVSGALADPVLELHEPDGTVIMNDNWKDTQAAAITASGVAPSDDQESAIIATLEPGAYTAIMSGRNGSTGVGLLDAYDLSQGTASSLANISTRGFVQTGDNVMIAGFIVGGTTGDGTIVVRGIGPSLAAAGVSGVMANPMVEVHDASGAVIAANDDWMDGPDEKTIAADGLAPTNGKEAAVLATLPPGAYTAILSGVGGTTGVGLVEVYDLH